MKKLFAMLLTAGLFITLTSNGSTVNWVKTNEGQLNCQKITAQGEKLKVVLENGEKTTLDASSVVSYFVDEKLYVKMPIFTKGIKGEAYMEFIKTRDNLSLFRFVDKGLYRYIVYKNNELYLEVTDNMGEFDKFFNL